MSAIPIHLQRRFEQRWASRFGLLVAATAPEEHRDKAKLSKSMVAASNLTPPIAVAILHHDGSAARCTLRAV